MKPGRNGDSVLRNGCFEIEAERVMALRRWHRGTLALRLWKTEPADIPPTHDLFPLDIPLDFTCTMDQLLIGYKQDLKSKPTSTP